MKIIMFRCNFFKLKPQYNFFKHVSRFYYFTLYDMSVLPKMGCCQLSPNRVDIPESRRLHPPPSDNAPSAPPTLTLTSLPRRRRRLHQNVSTNHSKVLSAWNTLSLIVQYNSHSEPIWLESCTLDVQIKKKKKSLYVSLRLSEYFKSRCTVHCSCWFICYCKKLL